MSFSIEIRRLAELPEGEPGPLPDDGADLFATVTVRAPTGDAGRFHVALGFEPVDEPSATHVLVLPG